MVIYIVIFTLPQQYAQYIDNRSKVQELLFMEGLPPICTLIIQVLYYGRHTQDALTTHMDC